MIMKIHLHIPYNVEQIKDIPIVFTETEKYYVFCFGEMLN